jgi:hypothetical protein
MKNNYYSWGVQSRIGRLLINILGHSAFLSDIKSHSVVKSNLPYLKTILMALIFLASASVVQAVTYYSRANGAWSTNSTWSTVGYTSTTNASTFPKAGDIAYIGGGFTVSVTANASCASIIIDAGAVLNPTTTRTVTATTGITINGTYTNQSTGAITTPSWICNGTYNHATSAEPLPKGTTTSTWAANSNCNITGSYTSATQFANFIGQTFGNFTFNPSAMTATVCLYGDKSGSVTVQGNFNIVNTGSNTLFLRQSGYPYVGELNINGNLTMNAGTFDLHNGGTTPTSSVVNLKGNLTLSCTSTMKQTTVQSGSYVKFNFTGTTAQKVDICSTASITSQATRPTCAIQFIVASGATIDMGTSVLKGTNNTSFTLSDGAGIITANSGGLSTSGTTGSIQVEGSRTYSTTANYTYNGTTAQVTGNALTTANNLTISNTSAAGVTLSNAVNVTGTFAVTTGAHANLGTFTSKASSIVLGGVPRNAGLSYGGNTSSANVIDPVYFNTNTGLLNVSLPPPTNLSYNSPFSFRLNTAITQQNPTVTGIVDSYSISPALPAGLNFNTTTGAITGTPTVNSPSTTYTVTATNAAGSTSCQIVISVGNFYYAVASGNWNTGIWAPTSGGTADGQIPVSGDIVFIGEAATNYTVTIPSGYAAACGSLTMGTYSDNTVATLNFADATSSLTVGNDLVMNRPNAAATSVINVNAGSMTVGGTLKLANADLTPDASTSLINQVNITTGTVTTKNLVLNGQSAPQSQVNFSGPGTLNISGDFTLTYLLGTLTPSTGKVNFNGTTTQTIPVGMSAVTYNNLTINNTSTAGATLSNAAITASNVTGNLSVGDVTTGSTLDNGGYAITLATGKTLTVANGSTLRLSGTSTMATAPGGKTFGATSTVNYCGSNQTVTDETYGHLILSGSGVKTMPTATTTVAGNFTSAGTVSATAQAVINTAGNFTIGSGTTYNASTFTHTVGANWENSGTFIPDASTIDFNTSAAGNIGTSNFNNITFSGAGTKTAVGALIIGGNVNISNNFTGGDYGHTVAGNWTNTGTFTPGTGLINFNGTQAQTINNGSSTFYNLSVTNTGNTCSAASTITSTANFATDAGAILDMKTYPLYVSDVDHQGTLLTQNTSATPITSGKTWGGLVNYNGAAAQTAVSGTYNDLTISSGDAVTGGSDGATASGDITVNGVLNLTAANASATKGALEMVTSYTGYPATDATYLTQTTNPIVSYTLIMGPDATTVGQGDVTGKIFRNSLVANKAYTFGNQFTTYAYTVAPTDVTVTVTIGTAYGKAGVWADPKSVQRSYEMVPTGGAGGRVVMNLHYLDSELNGNTESQLVTGDYDIGPDGQPLGDEHGRSSYDFTNNYIGLSGVPMSYFQYDTDTHKWRTVFTLHDYYTTHTVWNGSVSSNWTTDTNWSIGIPGPAMIAVIPDASATPNDPILAADQTIGGIQILSGGILNLNGKTITLAGYNYNGWEDQSGLSDYAGSTVIFTNTTVGAPPVITPIPISGVPDFNNLTINAGTNVTANIDSHISISGTFTNNGTFDASSFSNTVEYNGADQTVVTPVDNKYYNLTLSGSGTKTLPATLTVLNDFTLGGTASVASGSTLTVLGDNFVNNTTGSIGGTVILSGTNQQIVGGTAPATFSNLTINNVNGVMLGNNETVNGTLTLTNGVISTGDYTLTVGCSGSISGADATKYIEGKLARVYCNELTKDFPIGKGGYYRPMTLTYTENTSTTVTAEEFESAAISGTLPVSTFLLSPERYWLVTESETSGHTYNITLDGTGYDVPEYPVILKTGADPLNSYTATVTGNNYTASGLSGFSSFAIASNCPAPTIKTHPSSITTCIGTTATFTAAINETYTVTWQWQVSTDNGTNWSNISGSSYSGQTTATLTVNIPPLSMNGYQYRVVVTRNCGSSVTSNSATLTVNTANTWLGSTSTAWSTPANWSCGVPVAASNVVINSGTTYSPVVNIDNAVCNDLTINTGATLTIDPGQALTVGGVITGCSAPADAAKIQVKATTAVAPTVANGTLIIDCDKNSTLSGEVRTLNPIYATVELYAKGLKQDPATTWKDEITGSPTYGTTFTASYQWQHFGVPVETVKANPTFAGSFLRKYFENYNGDNTQYYQKWKKLTNDSILTAFKGYEITQNLATTYSIAGKLQFCDKTITLTRSAPLVATGNGNINNERYGLGQNIFGNSFSASIDITKLDFINNPKVEPTVYLYNTGSFADWGKSTLSAGQYTSIPQNTGYTIYDGKIPSMNGFLLIHRGTDPYYQSVKDDPVTMTLPYANGGVIVNTKPQTVARKPLSYMLVNLASASTRDNLWLFSEEGTTNKIDDGWDGRKFFGTPTAFIYTENADGPMQVSTDETIDGTVLSFYANEDTEYTLTLTKSNLDDYRDLHLIDLRTRTSTPLTGDVTTYHFTADSKGNVEKRFIIANSAFIDFNSDKFKFLDGYLMNNNRLIITNFTSRDGTMHLYDVSGKALINKNISTTVSEVPVSLPTGVYILQLQADGKRESIKLIIK